MIRSESLESRRSAKPLPFL